MSVACTLIAFSPLQVVALNKRSKEAESAFLGIYKQLIEAPGESHTAVTHTHTHRAGDTHTHRHTHRHTHTHTHV